jgi:hypothetical protein
MPAIPATWEAEIGMIKARGQKVSKTPISTNTLVFCSREMKDHGPKPARQKVSDPT